MLVLSRRCNESLLIGEIVMTVVSIRGDKVRLRITAPPEVLIHRSEVWKDMLRDHGEAGTTPPKPVSFPAGWKGLEHKGGLQLSRKQDECIVINAAEIKIVVVDIRTDVVRLGIDAPREIPVHRREVYDAIKHSKQNPS